MNMSLPLSRFYFSRAYRTLTASSNTLRLSLSRMACSLRSSRYFSSSSFCRFYFSRSICSYISQLIRGSYRGSWPSWCSYQKHSLVALRPLKRLPRTFLNFPARRNWYTITGALCLSYDPRFELVTLGGLSSIVCSLGTCWERWRLSPRSDYPTRRLASPAGLSSSCWWGHVVTITFDVLHRRSGFQPNRLACRNPSEGKESIDAIPVNLLTRRLLLWLRPYCCKGYC